MPHIKTTRIHGVHRVQASSAVPSAGLPSELFEGELAEIRAVVLREATADLSQYRPDLVRGSITRRMVLGHCNSAAEYAFRLRANPEEARALWLALHGHPGGFFRDADSWEALRTGLLGSLSTDRRHNEIF